MITVQIDDAYLEQRIQEEAQAAGKTPQTLVEELLNAALPTLDYTKLDPGEHGYIINDPTVIEYDQPNDVALFTHVTDAAAFTADLRKKAWRRP